MAPKLRCVSVILAVLALALPSRACFMLGDFTGDCRVDFQDLLVLADNWFSPESTCTEQGLIARWKLDESTANIAADASGFNRHGDLIGQPAWNPYGGKLAGALQLDGLDDHVVITGFKGITGSNPRTCTAWIKSSHVGGEIIGWGQAGVPGHRWVVRIDEDGYLRVEVGAGFAVGSTYIADNEWRHVAVVSEGDSTAALRFYIDGRPETLGLVADQGVATASADDVRIGVFAATSRYFNGIIDDIRIYDRQLSDQEVWRLANSGTTAYACLDTDGDEEVGLADFARLADYWNDSRPPVVINEFLADNDSGLAAQLNGATEYCDWIEIYNNSPHPVDLGGWCLTDKSDQLDQWRFPAGTILQGGGYLVVFASGKTLADNISNYPFVDDLGFLHTNFRLSNEGEYLALVAPDADTVVHAYAGFELAPGDFGYPPQEEDISYGLHGQAHGYFAEPTPGGPNRDAFDGYVPQPELSHRGGCYTGAIDVAITCPMPDTIIRYTTNGTAPTLSNGATYTTPIRMQSFTNLMVKCFRPGYRPSKTEVHPYIYVDNDVAAFNSNLPLVVLDTKGLYIYEALQPVHAVVIDTGPDGRAAVTGPVDFAGWGGIKVRGSSSTQFPKKQYAFETWDDVKEDAAFSILSMPSESDWIIHAPYSDKSLMRNYLSYKWSNDIGRYTVRTRFVEVFLNTNGGKVGMNDYVGVYIFMEKIKRDNDRVDITRLHATDNLEPEVSGGYIVKKDRLDPGDSGFLTSRNQRLAYVEPKEREITPPQRNWLTQYFNSFESALYGSSYTDPVNGYAKYIDPDSWIDVHIMVELTKNIDGYRLSAFMYKDRNDRLNMGPIWDYNLSLGNANYLNGWIPSGWYYSLVGSEGYPWYPRLFEDAAFKLRYADRWYALRRNQFATDSLLKDVDDTVRLLDEAQERNFERWRILGAYVWPNWYIAPTWEAEIDWMKTWLTDRLTWMDSQIAAQYAPAPPTFSRQGGQVPNAFELTISAPGRTVYYTLDGTDPLQPAQTWETTLVPENAAKKVLVPNRNIGTDWKGANEPYNDSGWIAGAGGVGYEFQSGYEPYFSIDVSQMRHTNESCYIRIPFSVDPEQLDQFDFMGLNVRYDDGFIAYLNGVKVLATSNAPSSPSWNSGASSLNDDAAAVMLENFDISAFISALRPGDNILAIHGLNYLVGSSDFLISAELIAGHDNISSHGIKYSKPVLLQRSTCLKARSYHDGEWSALQEAVFGVGPVAHNLRITEIMYHPWTDPNVLAPEPEFIELTNIGAEAINLKLCRFTDGIDFTFGNLTLAPGARTVVVNDRDIFAAAYPDFTGSIAGEYTGSLNNAGERITLLDAIGQTIHNFTYSDGWYDITDGAGFSLTIKDPTRGELDRVDGDLAAHWKLDEFSGPAAADASGNGRDAVLRGNPQWHSYGGKINGAIELDGDGDYVEAVDYKGVLGGNPRTCTAWVKTTRAGVQIMGWGLVGTPVARWIVGIDDLGRPWLQLGAGNVIGTQAINDGKWHHIAVVLAGPSSRDLTIYIDGRADAVSDMIEVTVNTQAAANVSIGAHPDLPLWFEGLIDNASIYDRALTSEEVALLAASADYWEDKQYWRPSAHVGGSPGADDTGLVPDPGDVVINEILAHSHAAQPDWIELHNTTDAAIDISGWFLSDREDDYMKFRIADGTTLAPYGYAVFYEDLHFGNAQNPGCTTPFAFSENGEALYVRSALDSAGRPTGFYDEEDFGASETGVAFGRYQKSGGSYNFVAMSTNTPGAENATPKVGPIVISEIMYNPPDDAEYAGSEYEFVELHNITDSPVTLQEYDPEHGVYTQWRFTDAIDYTFAPDTTIPAGGYLVVARNPQAFAAKYGEMENVVGPYAGKLANEGEKLEISMPGDTDNEGTRYYIRIDRVNYKDGPDWPQSADGQGASLTRINNAEYGNDPANWQAADPTPGS